MRLRFFTSILISTLLVSLLLRDNCQAAPGTPDSLDFAYGARIDVNGLEVVKSLRLAAKMRLDWVALDFDWAATQPTADQWNESTPFAQAMLVARSLGLNVLVSITNPPAWSKDGQGPEASASAKLVSQLAHQYSNLQAVELFPGANTRSGWGAVPNAEAYARVFRTVQAQVIAQGSDIYVSVGGLENTLSASEDIVDVDFLQTLYNNGIRPAILGLRLTHLTGVPLNDPSQEHLRHYEAIRAMMINNGNAEGLIWITALEPPIELGRDQQMEALWLQKAYEQMESQLYIGAAFYNQFNPKAAESTSSLYQTDRELHPFVYSLLELNAQQPIEALAETFISVIRVKQLSARLH